MSESKAQEPLDALQLLVNDVLVQTGKALRASRRDAQGNLTQAPSTMQSKLPDTIKAFHSALDDMEFDILRAKSVLLRDIKRLQGQKKQLAAQSDPPPIESQSKHPMTIDLDSSPPLATKDLPIPMTDGAAMKPMAPFPNMSIDLTGSNPMDFSMNEPDVSSQPLPPGGMDASNGNANPGISPVPLAPMPDTERKPAADMKLDVSGPSYASGIMPDTSGMNFTDMEFTLAPPANNESQGLPTTTSTTTNVTHESTFDLATFAPTDGGDMLALNGMLPMNPSDHLTGVPPPPPSSSSGPAAPAPGTASNPQEKVEGNKGEAADSTINNDIFHNDSGAADGMDFDFSLGGTGDDTFDDLMNNRDNDYELMDAGGDFDATFFGLDKTDET